MSVPLADSAAIDLALWQAASASDRVQEYLVYLERFPAGEFAALARERIAALSEATPEPAGLEADTAIELTFWESVKGSSNPALYEAYLAKYPDGNFVLLAKAMLDEVRANPPE
jgi:hypothetical protein